MHHEFEHMNEQGGEEVRKETQRKKKKTIHNKRNIYLFTIIPSSFFRPPPFPFPSLSNPRQASRQHRSKMRTRRLWMSLNPSPNSGEKLLGRARNLGTSSRRTFKSILPLGETKGPGPARISLPRSAGLRLPFLRTNRRLRAAYPRESLPRGGAMRRRPHASGEIPLSRIVPRGGGAAFTRDCESLEAGYLANSYDSFRGLISMRAGNKRWLRGINRPADPRGEILDRLIETRF